MALSIKGSEIL